jgi:Alpha-L-arabinofuranosidase C-terminal domain
MMPGLTEVRVGVCTRAAGLTESLSRSGQKLLVAALLASLGLALGVGGSHPGAALATFSPGIVVNAGQLLGPISLGLFTNNQRYEDGGTGVLDLSTLFSDPTIVPLKPDIVAYAQQEGVTGLRFPGGTQGDYYNWESGIGPVLSRPTCANLAGPPSACNSYGIMEHMEFMEAIGSNAVAWTGITLARNIRAQDAANFVEFVNSPDDGNHPWAALRAAYGHPAPYGVRFWALGNEVAPNKRYFPDVNSWLDGYAVKGVSVWDGALNIRNAMKAVDPTIDVGTGWSPKNNDLFNALQARNTRFDFADIHGLGGSQGSGTTSTMQNYTAVGAASHIADKTVALQNMINGPLYPALNGMIIYSWEIDVSDVALRYGLSHAVTNSVSMDEFIANHLTFESHTPFSALNTKPPETARAEDVQFYPSIPPDPTGNYFVNWIATAPSYAYKLYAYDLGTQSVASAISSDPTVTVKTQIINLLYVTAALDDRGDVLGVIVTNTDVSNDWTASLTLAGFAAGNATVEQVNGPAVTSVNTLSAPTTVQDVALPGFAVPASGTFSYTFPAHSVTAIDFSAAGS